SALAAPAFAGIPVTHRKLARSFTVITGHTIRGEDDAEVLRSAGESDTLIILMGLKNLEEIARRLIGFGRAPDTPAAVVERASYLNQRTVVGTLSTIGERAEGMESPATIIISPLAAMANDLSWFDQEETTEVEASPQLKSKIVG
ncbi:MAG: SAM-dependent methyltransferase, partial [Balneolaceae bacterium]